ncbi:hypothetical protein V8E51_019975 [Hyaloscypha variabilis]
MAGSFWLSWLLLTPVSALPWFGPQETFSATATADWSPVPTNGEHELFKRGLYPVNLCGWQGPSDQNVYCSSGSSCAWFTDYSVIGCCSISGSCDAVYTSCIDGKHPAQSVSYPGVLTCTSTSVCYLNKFPKGYSQYGCGTTSVGETVVTSYSDSNTQLSIAIVYTGGVLEKEVPVTLISNTAAAASSSTSEATHTPTILPVLSNSAVISGSTFSATPSPTSSSSPTPTSIPTTTPTSETSSKGLSTGAEIAIGVVAAAIAIIAVVLIILYYYFRRPKQAGTSHRHPFPNITGDGEGIEYVPPQEQFKGSENNPAEPYRSYQPQAKDIQYIPVTAPPYQTTEQTPFQSTTNTATVPTSPSRSPTRSAPTPTMTPIPDVFELPTKDSALPAIAGASLPELDNPETQNREMGSSHRESSITMAEGNLARLNREMEQVRAEKEMAIRLQQLERREAELKEQILKEQERLINE